MASLSFLIISRSMLSFLAVSRNSSTTARLAVYACADFLQQDAESFQARSRHVPELALVKIVNRLVERFQQAEGLRGDARLDHAAVVGLALPGDQAALLQAVKETRHVRVVGNHALSDAPAGQAVGLGPAKNAKDVVLGARKTCGFQKLLRFLADAIGGFQEGHEDSVLEWERAAGSRSAWLHAPLNIVVITTTVKR